MVYQAKIKNPSEKEGLVSKLNEFTSMIRYIIGHSFTCGFHRIRTCFPVCRADFTEFFNMVPGINNPQRIFNISSQGEKVNILVSYYPVFVNRSSDGPPCTLQRFFLKSFASWSMTALFLELQSYYSYFMRINNCLF